MERGSGILVALGLIIGAVIGVFLGSGAIGMVGGLVVGGAAAWIMARREAQRPK